VIGGIEMAREAISFNAIAVFWVQGWREK